MKKDALVVRIAEVERAREILRILKNNFSTPDLSNLVSDPFKILVRTIISQSTAEVNTIRAYENLARTLSITSRGLAKADIADIEDALKVAGLHRNKSRMIKECSRLILERFNGSLDFIYNLSLDEAREKLMSLPGVGPKTADIVLLFCAYRPTLPVDTHVNRVSKRLGLVSSNADYESVRSTLQALYPPGEFFKVHMLFIALGRRICKALSPLCASCPVNKLCPSVKI
ncbi:MAG: endonuclease III [Candidatus Bathyarchaeia archaeon]